MAEATLHIKLTANDDAPFTAMFEPTGMTYELAGSEHMTAEVYECHSNEIEIVHWNGGVSVWAPGSITTFDGNGEKLHDLN
ncbi:MAG TPA: hypothetical protein VGD48_30615 [Kutzneria sp.]